jgi:hypothetical protein
MEYSVDAPEFAGRKVTVETGGPFGGPRLLVDGVPVEKQNGAYSVPVGADGGTVAVRLKGAGLDVVPVAEVNGRTVRLAPPLAWYEYAWACLPILLLLVGGAIGGALGGAAAYTNLALFRSQRSPSARYGLSALVTLAATVGCFLIGGLLLAAVRRP